jgi:ABC-type glycerol-3-phosphate transport system substrate-binding protein
MHQLTTFQIVVLGMFIGFILVGVGVFAAFGGLSAGKSTVGPVVIWGTLEAAPMEAILSFLRSKDRSFENVKYITKSERSYGATLINAMANGTGPDLFLMSQDQLQPFTDKILMIPFGAISQGNFLTSFVDEGQLFLTPQGSLALPFTIDPLVMYWNKDMFASAGLANPPKYWNELLTIAPKITSLDKGVELKKSAVALGTWGNISNAKAILSALFMQAGDTIVVRNQAGLPYVTLGSKAVNETTSPAESALRFYTEFANPSKTSYSWNRSLPEAGSSFAAGDVAVYFGFASEYSTIIARNPNLHFGVALLPQIEGNTIASTYGKMMALAIPRTAHNVPGALIVGLKLTGASSASTIAAHTNLPPVRRDVPVDASGNAAVGVFVQSALISQGWLDPNPPTTDGIFQGMVESVSSGQSDPARAVYEAAEEMRQLVPR